MLPADHGCSGFEHDPQLFADTSVREAHHNARNDEYQGEHVDFVDAPLDRFVGVLPAPEALSSRAHHVQDLDHQDRRGGDQGEHPSDEDEGSGVGHGAHVSALHGMQNRVISFYTDGGESVNRTYGRYVLHVMNKFTGEVAELPSEGEQLSKFDRNTYDD